MWSRFLIFLVVYRSTFHAIKTNATEWCDLGCNVWLHDSFMYHCIQIHEEPKQLILASPTHIKAPSQCLYHSPSYNSSTSNITIHHSDNTQPPHDDRCLDCMDWHNGCTECLCLHDHNTSLCNMNLSPETCTSSAFAHCQTLASSFSNEYSYDVSMLLWFSILDVNTEYELWFPSSIITDLESILTYYISEYTVYRNYIQNVSCHMLYPYHYLRFYTFTDADRNHSTNITQLFHHRLPFASPNHTAYNDSYDTLFSTTEFIDLTPPNITVSPTLVPLDSISEYDGKYYNYMPQCALSFQTESRAIQFMTAFRNHSNKWRRNLHSVITYYLTHNVSLLLSLSEDTNETLYDYIRENGDYLSIQYVNNTAQVTDGNDTLDFALIFNRSLYSMQLNLINYYFGNLSHQLTPTLSPTLSPTKPRDCWFDGKQIQHNSTYSRSECYFVSCDNGDVRINDLYCDTTCYNTTLRRNNTCCVTPDGMYCGEENDDCPKQMDCTSCLDHQRMCSWNGDHCSAVCVGEYCWFHGECPAILIMRLHVKGITMKQANDNEGLINHAIAASLDITENLIKNYFPTQTPDNELIELKKTISLTENDEERIPRILTADNDEYVEQLNTEIIKAFHGVPRLRSTIVVVDVEYGGWEGNEQETSTTEETADTKWLTDDAFIILLVCGAMVVITICALCYRYPVLSYCCCCIPIKVRRSMKNWSRNYCCLCCQRFSFGVLYEDDVSDLIKRRREERRRNLHIRNEIMEEQHHLNARTEEMEDAESKEQEEYHQLKSAKKEKKRKRKHKKKRNRKRKSKSETHSIHDDVVEQTQDIAMTTLRNKKQMLYYDHGRDVIEVEENNAML